MMVDVFVRRFDLFLVLLRAIFFLSGGLGGWIGRLDCVVESWVRVG